MIIANERPTLAPALAELQEMGATLEHLDPAVVALAFSAYHNLGRDRLPYLGHLQRLGDEANEIARSMQPQRVEQVAGLLREVITQRHGYKGDETHYDNPENACLMRVIDRRRGLPVALGLIYMSVARALGADLRGLAFPDHFLVRLEFNGRRVVMDPFRQGEILGAPQLRQLAKQHLGPGAELRPEYYAPVSNLEVLLRLQNNLKIRTLRLGQLELAARIIEAMLALAPTQALLWREFGLALAELGQEQRALVALENFLQLSPDEALRHETARFVAQLRQLVTG